MEAKKLRFANSPVRVLGVDPSLSSTGFAYRDVSGALMTGTMGGGEMREAMRLYHLRKDMENLLNLVQPTHVAYEDYALGKRFGGQRGIYDTGELGGVFKTLFWERGIHVILVPPTSLKLIITGSGGGRGDKGKAEMMSAIERDFGYVIRQSDEADAAGLMFVGEMKCGDTTLIPDVRKSNRVKSLSKCAMIRGQLQLIANRRAS